MTRLLQVDWKETATQIFTSYNRSMKVYRSLNAQHIER